jgi:hypothetical protein
MLITLLLRAKGLPLEWFRHSWTHCLMLVALSLLSTTTIQAQNCTIEGRVIDAQTNEALSDVSVTLAQAGLGAITDSAGRYVIRNIAPGNYTLKASLVGYAPFEAFQVRIEFGTTSYQIQLQPLDNKTETIEITGSVLSKNSSELVSMRTLEAEFIQTNPGGNQDISRALQSLPGVSTPVGFRNDLIIRGGAPNENVFYLDGIEVPNINHFATQGSGGGPSGIIPSYMIQRVKFQTSAFSAKYDNVLSSAMDFELLTANSERFQSLINVSPIEFAVGLDSPIGKKVRITSSLRRSYLDFLFKGIGLPFLPSYWDVTTKVVWDINPKTSLTYIHIGALDNFTRNVPENASLEQDAILDGLPTIIQRTFTQGANLKRLTSNGFWTLALSRNFLINDFEQYRPLTDAQEKRLDYESFEAETKLRWNSYQVFDKWEINYGLTAQWVQFNLDSKGIIYTPVIEADTSFVIKTPFSVSNDLSFLRYGGHANVSRAWFNNRFRGTFGIRMDGNSFTDDGHQVLQTLSPRIQGSIAVSPRFSLNGSVGVYYRLAPYVLLAYSERDSNNNVFNPNKSLPYVRSTHFVFGGEFKPNSSLLISVESFLKLYDNFPVSESQGTSLANLGASFDLFGNERVLGKGLGRAYGAELLLQKFFTGSWYGIFSYTFFVSEYTGIDLTTRKTSNNYIRSAWDQRHIVSITGGYRFGKNKSWEISARVRASGGSPFTPVNTDSSIQVYPLTGEPVLDWNRLNQSTTDIFYQADLRVDKRYFFKKWSLNVYLDIQNVTGNENFGPPAFTMRRDANGFLNPPESVFIRDGQTTLVPALGVRIKY